MFSIASSSSRSLGLPRASSLLQRRFSTDAKAGTWRPPPRPTAGQNGFESISKIRNVVCHLIIIGSKSHFAFPLIDYDCCYRQSLLTSITAKPLWSMVCCVNPRLASASLAWIA
jgi:hypothetical protein